MTFARVELRGSGGGRERDRALKWRQRRSILSLFTVYVGSWFKIFLPIPNLLIVLGGLKIHVTGPLVL